MWLLLVMVIVVLNGEMIIAYDVSDGSADGGLADVFCISDII